MKPTRMTKAIGYVLWVALILAMVSSIQHLAWTFGTLERYWWLGWINAVAVDSGLAALTYAIQQRKKAKRTTGSLWAGVAFFSIISTLANLYHALSVESGGVFVSTAFASADWLLLTKAVVLSATLPAIVVYLSEIVSSDDVAEAVRAEKAEARAAAKAEKENEPPPPVFACPECKREFASQNALAGHAKAHKKQEGVTDER